MSYLTGNNNGLKNVTHLIIDEVHERDINVDFLLCIVKAKLENCNTKLILMSATLNIEKFRIYFGNCAAIEMKGQTYDIEVRYLEQILNNYANCSLAHANQNFNEIPDNIDVAAALVENIHQEYPKEEGILVFQPGLSMIEVLQQKIATKMKTNDYTVFIVHGQLNEGEHRKVFQTMNPNVRKIVLATNVAETSITIDGIVSIIIEHSMIIKFS